MKTTKASSLLSKALMLMILTSCIPLGMNSLPIPTIVHPISHLANNVAGLEQIWITEKAYIHWNDQDTTLDSSTGKTCFLGNLAERHDYYDNLICLESSNGKVLWNNYSGTHDEISVTPDGIFVTYIGPASVQKYDFQNGNFVWKNNKLGGGMGSSYLYFQDNQIEVMFIHERTVVLSVDGEIVRIIKNESIFVSQRDEIHVGFDGLQSNKANTSEILWKYEDTKINPAPLFTDDKIFVRRNFSETAYALDRNTGKLLWEIPEVLGNFAYSPNKQVVYALRENGDLLAIDENSGKESVIAKFSSVPFAYFDGVDNCGYQLSYDEKDQILIVYTGDSRQLFAFREK